MDYGRVSHDRSEGINLGGVWKNWPTDFSAEYTNEMGNVYYRTGGGGGW